MSRKIVWMIVGLGFFLGMNMPGTGWPQKAGASEKAMVLKASIQSPAGVPLTQELWWWLNEVEKRSGGRIKFERYPGQSLAKAAEQLDALESGMADVALSMPIYTPGKIPLSTITFLPFTLKYGWVNAMAYWQLVQEVPEVKAEFTKNKIKVVSTFATGPQYIFSNEPIRKLSDLKGRKIIGYGATAQLLNALGAAPLGIVIAETYEALQRGIADGGVFGPSAAGTYHMEEVCKHIFKLPLGGAAGPIGMNMQTWNKLPPDIQKMIETLQPEHAKAVHKIYQIDGDDKYMAAFKKKGLEITEPSADLMAEVQKIAKETVWKKWADDKEKRKLPGGKVLEEYLKLLEKNSALNPFK